MSLHFKSTELLFYFVVAYSINMLHSYYLCGYILVCAYAGVIVENSHL